MYSTNNKSIFGSSAIAIDNVDSYDDLKNINPTDATVVFLCDKKRGGMFCFNESDLSASVTADPQEGVYVPSNADTSGTSGSWVRLFPEGQGIMVDWFGTEGDGVRDDYTAIQAAIDWANSSADGKLRSGHIILGPYKYLVNTSLTFSNPAVKMSGVIQSDTGSLGTLDAIGSSLLIGGMVNTPVIFVDAAEDIQFENFIVASTATRKAEAIVSTGGTTNCGILFYNGTDFQGRMVCRHVSVFDQPSDGFALCGQGLVSVTMEHCSAILCNRHGFNIENGEHTLGGTAGTGAGGGIIQLSNCRSSNHRGHGIAVANPNSNAFFPYRVVLTLFETFRCGNDAGSRYADANSWIFCSDCIIDACAFGGTSGTSGSTPARTCLTIGGTQVNIRNTRFVECGSNQYVEIIQSSDSSAGFLKSRNIDIINCTASTSLAARNFFATIESGAVGVTIEGINGLVNEYVALVDSTASVQLNLNTSISTALTETYNDNITYTGCEINGLQGDVASSYSIVTNKITIPPRSLQYILLGTSNNLNNIASSTGSFTPGDRLIIRSVSTPTAVSLGGGTDPQLRLNGSVNFTMAVGDILHLVYDTNGWYEISRMVL